MSSCVHRWQLKDVQAPFAGLVACGGCGAVLRATLRRCLEQSTIRFEVVKYGYWGLGLDDLESALCWLAPLLHLGRQDKPAMVASAKPVRHKKKKRAA
jgi:predicted alpha/beta hydrolase